MLNYDELNQIASLKNLSMNNAEKDYLQELILFTVYSKIGEELVFKGGTCLYKIYKLSRFSEDLDFTLNKSIDVKKLVVKIINDLSLFNINGKIKEIKDYRNQKNIRLIFKGPLYKGNKESLCFIPLNISLRENTLLKPKREKVFTLYKEIQNFYVYCMDEEEIIAEKISAILTRDKARDIFDLWFLLKKGVNFNTNLVREKLKINKLNFNHENIINAVKNKKNLWEIDLKNLTIEELPKFEDVLKDIKSMLK